MDDLTGRIFGESRVTSFDGVDSTGNYWYNLECLKCGRTYKKQPGAIKREEGTNHKSCMRRVPDIKHPRMKRFLQCFFDAKARCENPKCSNYKHYGEKGVEYRINANIDAYDHYWNDYNEHCDLYGEKNTTIDRINPEGHYEIGNIRWATKSIQSINTRHIKNTKIKAISPTGDEFIFKVIKHFALDNGLEPSGISAVLSGIQTHHRSWKFYRV